MSEPEIYDEASYDDVPHDPTGTDLAAEIAHHVARTAPLVAGADDEPSPAPRRRARYPFVEERSGAHPDARDPQLLGSVLNAVTQAKGWQRNLSVSSVIRDWPRLVGADNASHSTPIKFDNGILYVECDSTAWATGMRYSASHIVARLNALVGDGTVQRVEISGPAAPSWKKGPRSVRDGRGPRDTYG